MTCVMLSRRPDVEYSSTRKLVRSSTVFAWTTLQSRGAQGLLRSNVSFVYIHDAALQANECSFDMNRPWNYAVAHTRNGNKKESTTRFWLRDHNLLNNKCQIVKHTALKLEKGSSHLLCQAHKAPFSGPTCLAIIIPICGAAKQWHLIPRVTILPQQPRKILNHIILRQIFSVWSFACFSST